MQPPTTGRGGTRAGARADRIRVVVRVRPTIPEDRRVVFGGDEDQACVSVPAYAGPRPNWFTGSAYSPYVRVQRGPGERREFRFDAVLSQATTQAETYDAVARQRVSDVLSGVNASIIMYGQTGSGKSFTSFGPPDDPLLTGQAPTGPVLGEHSGLIPRAITEVFDTLNAPGSLYGATLSYVQIYKDQVFDLLHGLDGGDRDRGGTQPLYPLQIREDRGGIFLSNVTHLPVRRAADVFAAIMHASARRAVAATQMNKHSSRSHVLLSLTIERAIEGVARRGVLTVVDLAGSERVSKTLSDGERLAEAKRINQSLSALGNCVVALSAGRTFVPFRDSTLTRLLTEPLSGNSRTVIVATVGPAAYNYDETSSTLQFAARCMALRTGAVVNNAPSSTLLQGIEYDSAVTLTALGDFAVLEDEDCEKITCIASQCPRCGAQLTVLPRNAVEAFAEVAADQKDEETRIDVVCKGPETPCVRVHGTSGSGGGNEGGEDDYSELSANKVTAALCASGDVDGFLLQAQQEAKPSGTEEPSSPNTRAILAENYVRSLRETIGILEAENARQREVLQAVRGLLRHGVEDSHIRRLLEAALEETKETERVERTTDHALYASEMYESGAEPPGRTDASFLAGVSTSVSTQALLDGAEALLSAEHGTGTGTGASALQVTTTANLPLVLSRTSSTFFTGQGSVINDYIEDELQVTSPTPGVGSRGGPLLISNEYLREANPVSVSAPPPAAPIPCKTLSPVSRAPLPVIIPKFRRV
ncbi:Kinesin like protein [Giardia muris]|uniref:Kinesin-like protein n=1 Tax=Giardia muris TaxID=5742 RepID=A0A4Z1SP42_GIAMU|nr:Kinesin like protein [Giardia muris]|eukprot:TNJ27594.1 Kinesin like protein [Giardia muris]